MSACCRRSPGSASRHGSTSAPGCAWRSRRARWRCSRPVSSSTRPRPSATTSCGCTSATGSSAASPTRVAAARRSCTAGDIEHFEKEATANVKVLAAAVRAGNDIVVPQPTCSYVLKKDYVDYVGGPDAELVAEHTYDAAEYLMRVHKGEDTNLDTRLPRRRPRDDHLPHAVPPPGPEHRPQEPRPDEAHRRQDQARAAVLGHRRDVGPARRERRAVAAREPEAGR